MLRLLESAPPRRSLLYRIAALSGFRRGELRDMQKLDLAPLGDKPRWQLRASISKSNRAIALERLGVDVVWQLRASISKSKRRDAVPIVPDLLPWIVPLWESLPTPTTPLCGGPMLAVPPNMKTLYADRGRVGVPVTDAAGLHADFHSLRYTFCRLMGEVLPIQKVKVLLRHSTIQLTADWYTQIGIDDLGEDVWHLPPVLSRSRSAARGARA